MRRVSKSTLFLFATLAIFCLIFSLDDNHYWHDIRFAYAASHFQMSEIISGAFNPHQLGGVIDEGSVSGFYLSKILHIWIIQQVYKIASPNEGGFALSTWLSVLYLGLTFYFSYHLYVRIFKDKIRAWFSLSCILLMPVTGYLAGKLLSEALAVMLISASLLCFVAAIDAEDIFEILMGLVSGLLMTLAALARIDIIICFFGFYGAYLSCADSRKKRRKLLKIGSLTLTVFGFIYLVTLYSIGGTLEALFQYFISFVGLEVKSSMMSILGIMTFGGTIYILSIIAILNSKERKTLFWVIWFVIAVGAEILITSRYMVEPRYLVAGLLPLAGLGGLGFDHIWKRINHHKHKMAIAASFVVFIMAFNIVTMKIMPYELNKDAILKAVDDITNENGAIAILIPWFYTDFHFLRMMRPNLTIFNVNSPRSNGQIAQLGKKWKKRIDSWNDGTYVDSNNLLNEIINRAEVFYLGWEKYPPVENTVKMLKRFRLYRLSNIVERIPMKNHLSESWLWNSDEYNLELAGSYSQYIYFKVTLRT